MVSREDFLLASPGFSTSEHCNICFVIIKLQQYLFVIRITKECRSGNNHVIFEQNTHSKTFTTFTFTFTFTFTLTHASKQLVCRGLVYYIIIVTITTTAPCAVVA